MKTSSDELLSECKYPPSIENIDPLMVPIKQQDVQKFEAWFCENEDDERLFSKLMQNIRMIDKEDLREGIEYMRQAILRFTDGGNYYLMVDNPGKSGDLILDSLSVSDKPPTGVIRFQDVESGRVPQIEKGAKLVIADDALYSGDRVTLPLEAFLAKHEFPVEDVLVTSVAMTNGAVERLRGVGLRGSQIAHELTIPVLHEILAPEEISRYKEKFDAECSRLLPDSEGPNLEGYKTRVLTFFYYKVPDNFLPGFRRSMSVLREISESAPLDETYIIDDTEDGIYPPYRKISSIANGSGSR
jgi:hypothetical protein